MELWRECVGYGVCYQGFIEHRAVFRVGEDLLTVAEINCLLIILIYPDTLGAFIAMKTSSSQENKQNGFQDREIRGV